MDRYPVENLINSLCNTSYRWYSIYLSILPSKTMLCRSNSIYAVCILKYLGTI